MFNALFNFADADGNGLLSFDEFRNSLSNLPGNFDFDSLDANGDGMVSLSEFMNAMSMNFDFNSLDTDGSGTLSIEECNKLFSNTPINFDFNAADTNHDGVLSIEEFMNATANLLHINVSGHEVIDHNFNYAHNIPFGGISCLSSSHIYSVTASCVNGGYPVS